MPSSRGLAILLLSTLAGCSSSSDGGRKQGGGEAPQPAKTPRTEAPANDDAVVVKGGPREPRSSPRPTPTPGAPSQARIDRLKAEAGAKPTSPAAPGWPEFLGPDGSFAISLPGTPTTREETVPVKGASVRQRVFEVASGTKRFCVIEAGLPAEVLAGRTPEEFLDDVQKGAARFGKVLESHRETTGRWPAREIALETPAGMLVRTRIVVAGGHTYEIRAEVPREEPDKKALDGFLGSFKLLRVPDSTPAPAPPKAKAEEWRDVSPDDRSFTLSFPGEPTREERPGDRTFTLVTEAPPRNFLGGVTTITKSMGPRGDYLNAQAMAAAGQGTLIDKHNIALGEAPGREVTVESNGLLRRSRFYLVGARLYKLRVDFPKEEPEPKDVSRFLDSLKVAAAAGE